MIQQKSLNLIQKIENNIFRLLLTVGKIPLINVKLPFNLNINIYLIFFKNMCCNHISNDFID